MRHRNTVKKMGRTPSHRAATLRNLASALIEHKQIRTTLSKAKAAQGYIDRLIGYGKGNSVHDRRLAFKLLQSRDLVKTLFDDIAPTFTTRNGGYTRIVKLGMRRGDGAPLAVLQLVGFEPFKFGEETEAAKPAAKKSKPKAAKAAATAAVVETATDTEKPKATKSKAKKAEKKEVEVEEAVEEAAEAAEEVAADVAEAAPEAEKTDEPAADEAEKKDDDSEKK